MKLTAVTNLSYVKIKYKASKLASAQIDCSFEMGKIKTFRGNINFTGDGTC